MGSTPELRAEVGHALRRARRRARMTLTEVRTRSGGRFSPTTVAGYERAERAITVERFCELATLYEVSPTRLLHDAFAPSSPALVLSQAELGRLAQPERRLIEAFVDQIRLLRAEDNPAAVITLRHEDVEILASAAGVRSSDLRTALRP